ncbi:hypothetical protein D3C73_1090670 [compost metagenome]
MWIIGGAGFIGSLLAFVFSFIPPSQISVGSPTTYVEILVGLTIFFCIIPFLIYLVRKPGWRDENSDFAPFTWQEKTALPSGTASPSGTTGTLPGASASARSPSARS